MISASKVAILLSSLTAGTIGFLFLKLFGKALASETDTETMDFQIDD